MARQNKKPVPKQRSFWKRCVKYRSLILMSLPGLIAVFIFSYIPMYGIQLAFRRYNAKAGILGSPWVGLYYFQRFFSSPYFGTTIKNTLILSLYGLLVNGNGRHYVLGI